MPENRQAIMKFLNHNFTLLDDKKDRFLLIAICFVFSIFFVNLFVPFNINRWVDDSGFIQFMRLSSYGLVVALVFLISQFPLRRLLGIQKFKVKTYILWLTGEIILISFVYILLYGNIIGNLLNDFTYSLKYTLLGIFLPYSFALLIIFYRKNSIEIKRLKKSLSKPLESKMVALKDENGKVKYSFLHENLLFFEAADNYVSVYFLQEGKVQRRLLRNSLKNIEGQLSGYTFKRCHRSFLINLRNLEFTQKDSKRLQLKMKGVGTFIPVSQKYSSLFTDFLSR